MSAKHNQGGTQQPALHTMSCGDVHRRRPAQGPFTARQLSARFVVCILLTYTPATNLIHACHGCRYFCCSGDNPSAVHSCYTGGLSGPSATAVPGTAAFTEQYNQARKWMGKLVQDDKKGKLEEPLAFIAASPQRFSSTESRLRMPPSRCA
jgi:hypothetical protein